MKASPRTFNLVLYIGLGLLFILAQVYFALGNLPGYTTVNETILNTLVNFLLLSIPLGLLCGSIVLLVSAWQQRQAEGQIRPRLVKWLYWAPRVAGILIILFVSLFALDVFEEGLSIWEMLGGFLMHMLPSIGMIIFLVFAWRREWLGFWFFLAAAVFFLVISSTGGQYLFGNILIFVAPLLLIALLFGANWKWRDELHRREP